MVYKKYVKRGGKIFGPYYYESYRDVDGKVKTRYLENYKPSRVSSVSASKRSFSVGKLVLVFAIVALFGFFAYSIINQNNNGFLGHVTLNETPLNEPSVNETVILNVESEIPLSPVLNETILDNVSVNVLNETILDNVSVNVLNETIVNETIITSIANETSSSESTISDNIISSEFNVTTSKARIVIGRPVRWIKTVKIESNKEGDVIIEMPKDAENISVKTGSEIQTGLEDLQQYNSLVENSDRKDIVGGGITGFVSLDSGKGKSFFEIFLNWFIGLFRITGKVIDESQLQGSIVEVSNAKDLNLTDIVESENVNEVSVEYYTDAPLSREESLVGGKKVIISGPDNSGYEDILAYSSLDNPISLENKNSIKLYHLVEGLRESVSFDSYDLDEDGNVDYIEWNVPHLSEQVYEIIYITKAVHLDASRNFVDNVYSYVNSRDDNWTTIPNGDYVRVTFEVSLDRTKDITIYARSNENSSVEVYRENGNDSIARFNNLNGEKNKVLLTSLVDGESYDTFDLRSIGNVEYDYILDPGCPASMTGSGTYADPCQITNCTQLQGMNSSLTFNYYLSNNIDCSDTINWNGGLGFEPVGNLTRYFSGNLSGGNFNISHLYISRSNRNYTGLFGASLAKILGVGMINSSVNGSFYVGALVGINWGSIENVTLINSTISGNNLVGSLVGMTIANVSNCGTTNANVSGNYVIGGLIGKSEWQISPSPGPTTPPFPTPYVINSYSKGAVKSLYTGGILSPAGGLIGQINTTYVNNTYSIVNVSGGIAGGLVGLAGAWGVNLASGPNSSISNSYSVSSVNGSILSGGLIAKSGVNTFNVFFVGNVTGNASNFTARLIANKTLDLLNAWWYNSTDSPQICVANDSGGLTQCNSTTSLTYFYNITNAPISSWLFPPWDNLCIYYFPPLKWEGLSGSGVCVAPPACPASMIGNGTLADPCQITTCTQLQAMNQNLSANYLLMNNINCLGFDYGDGKGFKPIGNGYAAIGGCNSNSLSPFVGALNGSGFNVTNLNIYRPDQVCVGLFSSLGNASLSYISGTSLAKITNFGLINANITGAGYVGGLVGEANQAAISNSFVVGNISAVYNDTAYSPIGSSVGYMTGGNLGGLAGSFSGGIIINSYSSGKVNGSGNFSESESSGSYIGGLIGFLSGDCNSSYSSANVFGDNSCGGLVGLFNGVGYFYHISNTYARGNVSCYGILASNLVYSGGLIGGSFSDSRITNSYSTGNVFGNGSVVGGLFGGSWGPIYLSNITSCFSVSNVTGNGTLSGLLSGANYGDIINSYYFNYSSSLINCSGTGNSTPSCSAVNNKTLFYFNYNSPLTSWDFNNVWMELPNDYPILRMGNVSSPVCVADRSCAASTCSGSTCTDACGNPHSGTKTCTTDGGGGGGGDTDCSKVLDYTKCGNWSVCDKNNKVSRSCVSVSKPSCSRRESKDCGCVSNISCSAPTGSCDNGRIVRICEDLCTGESYLFQDSCNKIIDNLNIDIDYPAKCPDAVCSDWSDCEINYNFVDLISGVEKLKGVRRSLCSDETCGASFYKEKPCYDKINVTVKKIEWCGETYIEIVDKITGKAVSLINENRNSNKPSLDISILDEKPKYCEYCYNGVQDHDEEETDCGGSCRPCGIQESYWMTWLQRVMWFLRY